MPIDRPLTLINFNFIIEGENQAGLATSLKIPILRPEMVKANAGLSVARPVFMGLNKFISLEFKTAEYGKLQKYIGKQDTVIQGYGSLNDTTSHFEQVKVIAKGLLAYNPSTWGVGKKTDDRYSMYCVELNYSGHDSNIFVSTLTNTFMVNGEDLIETQIRNKIQV